MTSIGKTGIALAGAMLLCVEGTAQAAPAVLTFKRYENTYRLASVWDSNEQGFDLLNH